MVWGWRTCDLSPSTWTTSCYQGVWVAARQAIPPKLPAISPGTGILAAGTCSVLCTLVGILPARWPLWKDEGSGFIVLSSFVFHYDLYHYLWSCSELNCSILNLTRISSKFWTLWSSSSSNAWVCVLDDFNLLTSVTSVGCNCYRKTINSVWFYLSVNITRH